MTLEPFDWNVVIAAYWNRAILTPNGIAKRLFKVPLGTGMEVFVPVDMLEPPQVKYEHSTVRVEDRRLIIGANQGNYQMLTKAMEMGRNALDSLPDTPVLAAGFNIRLKTTGERGEIDRLVADPQIDGCLSDGGYEIVGRLVCRKVRHRNTAFEKGIITLSLDVQEEAAKIELNFQRDSRDPKDLVDWLSIPASDVEKAVDTILLSCGDIEYQEKEHV
jgi:hypothetical protein